MTVEEWLAKIVEIVSTNTTQLSSGEITPGQATEKEQEVILRARLDLSDKDGAELLDPILATHQIMADNLKQAGHSVPGNDPDKPTEIQMAW